MKLFVVALLIAAASAEYVQKTREDLIVARKECIAELNVPPTLVAEYQKRQFTADGVTPCYVRCVFTKLGLFEHTTGFNIGYYLQQLGKGDGVSGAVKGCIDNSGADTCMWAFNSFICFGKNGLLPEGY